MSLSMPWVEKIFLKLTLNFGNEFLNRWKGIDIDVVKADWAHELRGLQQNPKAIAFGLEHCLEGKPPTVSEFRAMCIRIPSQNLLIPSPPADPELVEKEIKKMERSRRISEADCKAWAHRLKARDEAGDPININQRRCYRNALGLQVAA